MPSFVSDGVFALVFPVFIIIAMLAPAPTPVNQAAQPPPAQSATPQVHCTRLRQTPGFRSPIEFQYSPYRHTHTSIRTSVDSNTLHSVTTHRDACAFFTLCESCWRASSRSSTDASPAPAPPRRLPPTPSPPTHQSPRSRSRSNNNNSSSAVSASLLCSLRSSESSRCCFPHRGARRGVHRRTCALTHPRPSSLAAPSSLSPVLVSEKGFKSSCTC